MQMEVSKYESVRSERELIAGSTPYGGEQTASWPASQTKTEWKQSSSCTPSARPRAYQPVMTEMASPETDVLRNMATVTNFSQNLTGPIVHIYADDRHSCYSRVWRNHQQPSRISNQNIR
jgi:hypothetical protein